MQGNPRGASYAAGDMESRALPSTRLFTVL